MHSNVKMVKRTKDKEKARYSNGEPAQISAGDEITFSPQNIYPVGEAVTGKRIVVMLRVLLCN